MMGLCRYRLDTVPKDQRGRKTLCIGCPNELDCKDDGEPRI